MAELRTTFRNHFLSIYQSAAADYARKAQAAPSAGFEAAVKPDVLASAADRIAELRSDNITVHGDAAAPPEAGARVEGLTAIASECAALGLQYLEAKAFGDRATAERLKGELASGTCDPRWAETLVQYADYFGIDGTRAKIPYVTPAVAGEKAIEIKAGARIGLIGDWGTGAAPARRVLEQLKAQKPDILVHLGDIYYSGTDEECRKNFEAVVNSVLQRPQNDIPVYTLSGNHDMYCGGLGYYAMLKRLNTGGKTQPASFFCLRASDQSWQLLAMDTGLHDYSPVGVTDVETFVEADEQAWLKRRIQEFAGKTILLSHHQLFSAFSQIGKKDPNGKCVPYNKRLKAMLDDFRSTGKPIPAWIWGHEHNLCIFQRYLDLDFGRCLGHSAVPVLKGQDSYLEVAAAGPLPQIVDKTCLPMDGSTYVHGFAMLTLGGEGKAKIDYFNADSATAFYSETIA